MQTHYAMQEANLWFAIMIHNRCTESAADSDMFMPSIGSIAPIDALATPKTITGAVSTGFQYSPRQSVDRSQIKESPKASRSKLQRS
jgi:hypothetical protein